MRLPILLAAGFMFASCQTTSDQVQVTNQGPAQGSTYSISYIVDEGVDHRVGIDSILKEMDRQMSLWVEGSVINKLNAGDSLVLPKEMQEVIAKSITMAQQTDGSFDITLAPVIKAWGFSRGQYNENVPIDSLLEFVGASKLPKPQSDSLWALPKGFQLDVNGIAQGWTVDAIVAYLQTQGVSRYMVEVGGEVRSKGTNIDGRKWRIGIERPLEERTVGQFQAIVELDTMSLATSGNYRKFWTTEKGQKVVHTIDPKTGRPVISNLLSASVIARTATEADALGTACMVKGNKAALDLLESLPNVEGMLIVGNRLGEHQIIETSGWKKYAIN